ncbi:MAG TPA: flagellar biosynthesis anti-sigma factor FlgM [Gemmatimonadales bacterium]|nr:flagellar biosynthesis anti-sigma factor FlgM [Gemmatimonadales bacterium]
MAIDPLGSGGIPEAGARRVSTGGPDTDAAPRSQPRPTAADSVEVSSEARRLATPDIPVETLPADYLREVTQRVADGSYNSDAAIKAIAEGVTRDIG